MMRLRANQDEFSVVISSLIVGVNKKVENRLLAELPQVESSDLTTVPLLLIDTAGCNLFEAEAADGDSRYNEVSYYILSSRLWCQP